MRYIRYLFLATLAVVLITVALANRGAVTLTLLPGEMGTLMGMNYSIEVPLFLVIFGGILAGLAIGFVWEWMREYKHRAEAARKAAEVRQLERELKRARGANGEDQDEVLALLDKAS